MATPRPHLYLFSHIVQLLPLSQPAAVIYAQSEPTADGHWFMTDPIICWALMEIWHSASDDEPRPRNADRTIWPVTLDYASGFGIEPCALAGDERCENLLGVGFLPLSEQDVREFNDLAQAYVRKSANTPVSP